MLKTRYITIELELEKGKYFQDKNGIKTIVCNSGYGNAVADIEVVMQGSGFSAIECQLTLYGQRWEDIMQYLIAQFENNWNLAINKARVYAGNELINGNKPPLLVEVQVVMATADFDNPSQSNRALVIQGFQGGVTKNQTSQATIIGSEKPQTLQFLFSSIIAKSQDAGLTAEVSQVTGNFVGVHLEGNWESQLAKACVKFGYQWRIIGRTVYVAPQNKALVNKKGIAIISDDNVKFKYPRSLPYGLEVNTWYDQTIIFGQRVQLATSVTRWEGEYNIIGMHIMLSNNTDKWYNVLQLTKPTIQT